MLSVKIAVCLLLHAGAKAPNLSFRNTAVTQPWQDVAMPNSASSTSPERSKQEEFVLRTIEERNIRFIRLWFTDVLGFLKSVAIAPAELESAFDEGIGFDGSAIEGFARVTESDMLARPDSATFSILPWRTEVPGAARMFCDIAKPDGSASMTDPRNVLRRTLNKAAEMGYTG